LQPARQLIFVGIKQHIPGILENPSDVLSDNRSHGMAQAIVDAAELRRFAQTLKKLNTELADRMTRVSSQLADLSNTWRDQENAKFREEFEQHMRTISRFIEANNQHIPYLLRKAERIEEYVQQR
jgi:uncharacterized protein YukE